MTRVLAAVAVLAAGLLALTGCSPTEPAALVPKPVAAPTPADPAAPCAREAPESGLADQPRPAGLVARYDRAGKKIVLSGGKDVTLPALSKVIDDPDVLREVGPGEWLLGADLEISGKGSLKLDASSARWLKLRSDPDGFASIRIIGGSLTVSGTCVTSWDTKAARADTADQDGRSFLLARDGGQLNIDHAEVRFLGFGDVESYGLAWRLAGTGGGITNSIVSNLYFGMYSYEVGGLTVSDNEFYDNAVYGIDPHTGSHDLHIERNVVHDNGKHGIILAEDCVDSVISGNVVYRNQQHGIVLYLRSDRNTVEQNEVFDNADQGINVNESSHNTIQSNRVYHNAEDGIGVGQSATQNTVARNDIRANQQDGVRLVSLAAQNDVRDNIIGENVRYGVYVDSDNPFTLTGNTIYRSRTGVLLTGTSSVPATANTIFGNAKGDIRND